MGHTVRQIIAGFLMLSVLCAGIEAAVDWHAHEDLADGEPGVSVPGPLDSHVPHDSASDCDHCCHISAHLVALITGEAASEAAPVQLRHAPQGDFCRNRGDPPPNPPPIL